MISLSAAIAGAMLTFQCQDSQDPERSFRLTISQVDAAVGGVSPTGAYSFLRLGSEGRPTSPSSVDNALPTRLVLQWDQLDPPAQKKPSVRVAEQGVLISDYDAASGTANFVWERMAVLDESMTTLLRSSGRCTAAASNSTPS
jgi:hypothetical protein